MTLVSEWLEEAIKKGFLVEIAPDQLKNEEVIGRGGYGEVTKCEWKAKGILVACKRIINLQEDDEYSRRAFIRELKLQNMLYNSKYVIQLLGVSQDPTTKLYRLVLDYADGGTLRNYLCSKKKELSWPDKIKLSTEIANGLLALHNAKIVHLDLVIVLETLKALTDDTVMDEVNVPDFEFPFIECYGCNCEFEYEWDGFIRICPKCVDEGKEYKVNGKTQTQVRKYRIKEGLPYTCTRCENNFDTINASDPCIHCLYAYLKTDWTRWTSGYPKIDEWIHKQQVRSSSITNGKSIEFIRFSNFKNIRSFDEGGFSSVSKAIWIGGGYREWNFRDGSWNVGGEKDVALKKLFEQNEENVFNELYTHFVLSNSEFVCQLYGISLITSTRELVTVMELGTQGNLRQFIQNNFDSLTWKDKLNMLHYAAKAIDHLHNNGFLHRDLHPLNFIMQNNLPKLIDFQLCTQDLYCGLHSEVLLGVLPYIDPVVLYKGGKGYNKKSDIYSFGIIMSEVFTGYPPYYNVPFNDDLAIQICSGRRPEIRCEVPQLLLNLMSECLSADPRYRPTAEELKNTLGQYYKNVEKKETDLYTEVEKINKSAPIYYQAQSALPKYQTHPQAIYTSRLLNFQKLPKPESVKVDWIGVPVPKDIIVGQFYKELIARKIVSEVRLDNEVCLQSVKAVFLSNITGPFNVISMECNMIEAIEV
ncbi:19021_t:CDS:2 [Cetraspora pellucida]|uniref:19021_t:CDS:1 n=1 Tax=Cetraspora pellucida TaxID=1433469 RepID=A0A9N9C8P0_9GLOM|nr:19021_t:CDS:2 [Cetraspora pellucida]